MNQSNISYDLFSLLYFFILSLDLLRPANQPSPDLPSTLSFLSIQSSNFLSLPTHLPFPVALLP